MGEPMPAAEEKTEQKPKFVSAAEAESGAAGTPQLTIIWGRRSLRCQRNLQVRISRGEFKIHLFRTLD